VLIRPLLTIRPTLLRALRTSARASVTIWRQTVEVDFEAAVMSGDSSCAQGADARGTLL
jgi:hypothetical protein